MTSRQQNHWPRRWVASLALTGLVVVLTGCGSESPSVDLDASRACLAAKGYRAIPSGDYAGALPGSAAPNLAMARDGQVVEIVLEDDQRRARGLSADLRGALASFGNPAPARRVVRVKNAVVVLTPAPGRELRTTTLRCVSGS